MTSFNENDIIDERSVKDVQSLSNDCYKSYHVHRRKDLQLMSIANVTVIVDVRSRHLMLSAKLGVKWKFSRGRTIKVEVCGHEKIIVKHVEENE